MILEPLAKHIAAYHVSLCTWYQILVPDTWYDMCAPYCVTRLLWVPEVPGYKLLVSGQGGYWGTSRMTRGSLANHYLAYHILHQTNSVAEVALIPYHTWAYTKLRYSYGFQRNRGTSS